MEKQRHWSPSHCWGWLLLLGSPSSTLPILPPSGLQTPTEITHGRKKRKKHHTGRGQVPPGQSNSEASAELKWKLMRAQPGSPGTWYCQNQWQAMAFVLSLQGLRTEPCQACSAQTSYDLLVLFGLAVTAIFSDDEVAMGNLLYFCLWLDHAKIILYRPQ